MAKILVYNNNTNRMETYYRGEQQAMPYNTNNTLLVREFRGSSRSEVLWTTRSTMLAWNSQRYVYGAPIKVGFAFKRVWEGGHSGQSQHYAGVAFDVGQNLNLSQRTALYNTAVNIGVWSFVEPLNLTPSWVHFDKRQFPPACATGGYPLISRGSKGVYVLVAQDGLNTLGYSAGSLDGIFGNNTRNAVIRYQSAKGLVADGIVGCNTWRALQSDVVGIGRKSTTID
ncbi:MAG: peptidoglycan-binding protein [Clostridia bacterium]|nr:peptidoglycan-binding protein [Clostridia bacterium]